MTEQLIVNHLSTLALAVQNKSASGRGSSKKIDLYGIKKLRELILELAVRGKLVAQNPEDEPASKLLERIKVQKGKLIFEKKIKKPKKLPCIEADEIPKQLPTGWGYVRLGDVINVLNGRAYKKHEMLQEGTPLLRVGNLFTSNEWYYSDLELEPEKYIDNGDLIYAWSASFGPFIWNGGKAIYHYHIWKLDLFHEASLSKHYLFNYLLAITESIKASGSGIAMIHMTKDSMEKLILSIPPLEEQHRIVTKVDELMALCDQIEQQTEASLAAHTTLVENLLTTLTNSTNAEELKQNWQRIASHFTTLFTTEASIDQLKQTILQLAVMGKLVPQDPNDEPAAKLLERIAAEKALLVKEGKIKKQKPLPPIAEDERPFELPDGWEWCQFGNAVSSRLVKMLDKAKNTGTLKKYLRNTNVQWQRLDLDDLKEMKFEANELEEFSLKFGDLLICEGGEPGRCAIWQSHEQEIYFQKALQRARPWAGILPKYLEISLMVDTRNKRLAALFTGATIKHLPGDKLAKYLFFLPPVAEQHRIVTKVDQLMTLCNQIKTYLQHQQQTHLHLADVLVEQALT